MVELFDDAYCALMAMRTDHPEKIWPTSFVYPDEVRNNAETMREAFEALQSRIEALEAALRDQTARADKHWRTVNDKQYMIEALVSMLGPTALTVWRGWLKKGIQRVHYSWEPDAANLSGEDRAKIMLEWDNAPRTLVSNVDAALKGTDNG